jgi:ABC-type Fe3+-citrate transport system substrate-binding protein
MTVIERINLAVSSGNYEHDNIDKLISLAYHIGKEIATREVCDKHTKIFNECRERAKHERYYNIANRVLGNINNDVIYHPDYAMDMKSTFGSDETNI